jgi:superfamily II DNA or RNA helicase
MDAMIDDGPPGEFSPLAPLIDAVDVIRLVGPRAFNRAKEYAAAGAVTETAWHAADERITGTVQGTEATPYVSEIVVRAGRGDYSRPVRSTCSCPIGGDCKHVAAVLLQSNTTALLQRRGTTAGGLQTGADTADPGGGAVPRPSGGDHAEVTGGDAGDWRSVVGSLGQATRTSSARTTGMGLLFEVRDRSGVSRSDPRRPVGGSGRPAPRRLGVRPVTLSGTGNWVRGSLTWSSLPYQLNRLAVDPDQHAWFGQFAALHRSVVATYVPGDSEWLHLDDFASPLLWPLLAEARRLGVAFVTGKRATDVMIADAARVTIDATRGADGSMRLTAGVAVDGDDGPAAVSGVVGDHGVWTAETSPTLRVTLAPTASALGVDERRLLTITPEIVVPADETGEFLTEFYPGLRRSVDVVSSDSSVELPELVPPALLLTIGFERSHTIRLGWGWSIDGRRLPVGAHGPLPVLDELGGPPRDTVLTGLAAAEFSAEVLPTLEAHPDVVIDLVGPRPDYRRLTDEPHLTVTTIETDKRDWFDLGVLITVEGRTVPLVPLLTAIAKRQRKLLLVDGSYLSLGSPVFDELKRLLDEATSLDEWETGPRINRYQAGLWAEIDDLADETVQTERWRSAVGGLLGLARRDDEGAGLAGELVATPPPVPTSIAATLRPYQREGFEWLAFLYEHGLGGVLADDMGLGKTLQTLTLMTHVRETEAPADRRPFLVVAPTSVVSNWALEAARFAPGLVVHAVTETEKKSRGRLAAALAGDAGALPDVVVTSYALFRLDAAVYRAHEWAVLVLDEAQFVKNRGSQAHRAAVELDARVAIAITGTPLENSLMDLWSLFRIVAPGLLSSASSFTESYVKPIESGEGPEHLARLRRRIRPLLLRRTKELVAADLPAKQEQVLRVDLAPAHRELYDAFLQRERLKLLDLIDDLDRNRFIVFRSLTLLRMLSLDAALLDDAYSDIPSAKLDQLIDELDDVVAGGHRALVFSQFTSFLGRVAARLDERGIAHEYLDGSTRRRAEVIRRFRTGDAPAFLISLKAGGFGLTLTEADYVFMLDPWWNPAAEAQAVDRTHRIGQTKNVMVYRMIANGTIEEKVLALQQKKAQLFDAVMDDDAVFSSALTADDIRGLLDD